MSIDYANQRSYLDDLSQVYPMILGENRDDIEEESWKNIKKAFKKHDDIALITHSLKLDLFPIKDSYVAYLRRDKTALERNPKTVQRLCKQLYKMGLEEMHEHSTKPKETNRRIGPLFRQWLNKKSLGLNPVKVEEFLKKKGNAILDAGDREMADFAKEQFGYKRDKGLDFVARFNGKYVFGEAKFLTDIGGHQNAQFNDAITTITTPHTKTTKAIPIAILDGVLYIKSRGKMYKEITGKHRNLNIMSALVLRKFLNQI